MIDTRKVAVIGCGFVGSACAFTLMQHGLFSEMVLIDLDKARAEGEAMDISHGLLFAKPMNIYAGTYADAADADIAIVTAGANQKPGETRLDLVRKNSKILISILEELKKCNFGGILLIVSNPVDILTRVAQKYSGLPEGRVFGSGTVLDTARLKYLLGEHLSVDSRGVHAFIIGEHGDSELAVWSSANVSGMDLPDYCRIAGKEFSQSVLDDIYQNVRDAAYHIIEGKGATYYGIGMAVLRIARAIVRGERSVLPVSSVIQGRYGVDEICLGLPSVLGKNGIETVLDLPLSYEERKRLESSAAKLRTLLDEMKI